MVITGWVRTVPDDSDEDSHHESDDTVEHAPPGRDGTRRGGGGHRHVLVGRGHDECASRGGRDAGHDERHAEELDSVGREGREQFPSGLTARGRVRDETEPERETDQSGDEGGQPAVEREGRESLDALDTPRHRRLGNGRANCRSRSGEVMGADNEAMSAVARQPHVELGGVVLVAGHHAKFIGVRGTHHGRGDCRDRHSPGLECGLEVASSWRGVGCVPAAGPGERENHRVPLGPAARAAIAEFVGGRGRKIAALRWHEHLEARRHRTQQAAHP